MITLSRPRRVRFLSKKEVRDHLSWLPDKDRAIDVRPIVAKINVGEGRSIIEDRYLIVVDGRSEANSNRLNGEVLCRTGRSSGVVFSPLCLYTLDRLPKHIEQSEAQRLELLQAQISALRDVKADLAQWKINHDNMSGTKSVLKLLAQNLGRAHTPQRQEAAERLGSYCELRDSLGRPNRLITEGQVNIAIRKLLEQLRQDERTQAANWIRQLFVDELHTWASMQCELALVSLADGDIDATIAALRDLTLKPYSYMASFMLTRHHRWDISQFEVKFDLAQAIASEEAYLSVYSMCSAIDRTPKVAERLLPGVILNAVPGFNHGPYQALGEDVKSALILMAVAAGDQGWERVRDLAHSLKQVLRYRPSWPGHQRLIFG